MAKRLNIAIAGAGPAGSSLAIRLGQAGHTVTLFDKAIFPRGKPCGEGLMPKSLVHLEDLGVLHSVQPKGARFHGIAYVTPQDRAEAHFPQGRGAHSHGLGIARSVLDFALVERAQSLPSVSVHQNVAVKSALLAEGRVVAAQTDKGDFACDFLVAADGRMSRLRKQAGLEAPSPVRTRGALVTRLRVLATKPSVVEVHLLPEGEAYITPTGEGWLQVVLCLEKSALDKLNGDPETAFRNHFQANATLRALLDQVIEQEPIRCVGKLSGAAKALAQNGLFLVGDAAGFLDPVTGEGTSLALADSAALALALEQFAAGASLPQVETFYAKEAAKERFQVQALTTGILTLFRYRPFAAWIIRRFQRHPALLKRLVAVAAGLGSFQEIQLREAMGILLP